MVKQRWEVKVIYEFTSKIIDFFNRQDDCHTGEKPQVKQSRTKSFSNLKNRVIRAPSSIKKKHKLNRNESFRELSTSWIPTIDSREKKKKHNFMRKASWVSKQSYGKKI